MKGRGKGQALVWCLIALVAIVVSVRGPREPQPETRGGDEESDTALHVAAGDDSTEELSEIATLGFEKIFVVAGLERVSGFLPLPKRLRNVAMSISVALLGSWPLAANAILGALGTRLAVRSLHAWLTLVAGSAADMVLLLAAWIGWEFFALRADLIDELIRDRGERHTVYRWLRGRMGVTSQLVPILLFAPVPIVFTKAAAHFSEITAMSYASNIWIGILGANALYWLIRISNFMRRVFACSDLDLYWFDPARTPIVVNLCMSYIFVEVAVLAGTVALEIFAILIPAHTGSVAINVLTIAIPSAAGVIAVYVIVQVYAAIYRAVGRFRSRLLSDLAGRIRLQGDFVSGDQHQSSHLVETYTRLRETPRLPVGFGAVNLYVAGIIGTLLAYLLQRFGA